MPFEVKQVLDLYFEHKDTKRRPSDESDVWDFEASKMKTYTPVEETTHYPQATSAMNMREKARNNAVLKKVEVLAGRKGFLYHSTEQEKIEDSLKSKAYFYSTKGVDGVECGKPRRYCFEGVIGSFSKNHLSTSTTILSACSHAFRKYTKGEWKASINANGKFILVVIPPSVTSFLWEKRRLVSYYNDSYVKIEGICIPLQDMRGVADDITYEALAEKLVPGYALVFEIDCKWDAVRGQLM